MRHLLVLAFVLSGCTSVYQLEDGRYVVPRHAETRSLFGTNVAWSQLELCKSKVGAGYTTTYTECHPITAWTALGSPGAGGLIVQGALIGGGLAGAGALSSGASAASSATSSAIAIVPHGKGK